MSPVGLRVLGHNYANYPLLRVHPPTHFGLNLNSVECFLLLHHRPRSVQSALQTNSCHKVDQLPLTPVKPVDPDALEEGTVIGNLEAPESYVV